MKKVMAVALLVAAIFGVVFAYAGTESGGAADAASYLRVHIRADSDAPEAQAVKYEVRDAVVAYLTPLVAEAESKEEAMRLIGGRLGEIGAVAEGVLRAKGFSYGARASLRREEFPTRVYADRTLGAGVYDALILELGSGKGENWWCVVYPPLCFTSGGGNVVYKSKIKEIVEAFFGQ